MSSNPVHLWVPIHWSITGLRQIMGQEIAKVTGDDQWRTPLSGTLATWNHLRQVAQTVPRIAVWEGPWLLMSDAAVFQDVLARYDAASPGEQIAIREALWFWGALDWGYYANVTTWAIESYLMTMWPPDFWKSLVRWPSRPVRDWLRLERRVMYLRVAIEAAAEGRVQTRWGQGWIDCRPLVNS